VTDKLPVATSAVVLAKVRAALRAARMITLYRNFPTAYRNRMRRYLESDKQVTYRLRAGVDLVAAPGPHDVKIVNEIWMNGEYAAPGFVPQIGWTVVDLGANKGFFATWALTRAAAVHVHCFEPDPRNAAALRHNIGPFADQVTVTEAAVGSTAGTLTLHRLAGRAGQASLSASRAASRGQVVREIPVPVVPTASVLSPLGDVDLLKVDIEGGEYAALLDVPAVTFDRVSRIAIEADEFDPADPTRRREDLLAHLAKAGFRTAHRTETVYFLDRG
jgi:FkbM family methyltransferase